MRTAGATHRTAGSTARQPAPVGEDDLVLGRYRLVRRLGAGGFGVVWQAHDSKLERDVAVKVMVREHAEPLERSRVTREALAAARLNHPGIVALYELGSDERHVYLVSELVAGATLAELARAAALSDRDVARIGQTLFEALAHAHAHGVVHRDVKPGNVMVLAEPAAGAGFAKLTDFGVAHVAGDDGLTATGDVLGTLAYMAPEQAEGRRATGACDVYALALTLYEAWTGTNPVRASSPAATARRLGEPLPPLRSKRPELPPALGEAIDAALDPDPLYRPAPAELRAVLIDAGDGLCDAGGLIEPRTIERFGLSAVRLRTRLRTLLRPAAAPGRTVRRAPAAAPAWSARRARAASVARRAAAVPSLSAGGPIAAEEVEPSRRVGAGLASRLGAGIAGGLLVAVGLAALGPAPPLSPAAAGGLAALAIALLPRLGWLLAAACVCVWLASPEADQAGTALVLAAALAPVPLLLPRAGVVWSLPALAPLLGSVALAPLFVAVAALGAPRKPGAGRLGGGSWRRAGLAAAGLAWLTAAEALTGERLLYGSAEGALPRPEWQGSAVDAAQDALLPLVTSPALAPAFVWAGFAVALGLILRTRWVGVSLLLGVAWVVGLVAAHAALGDLLAQTTQPGQARGAVAGALLGGSMAVTVSLLAPARQSDRGVRPLDAALP